MLDLSDFDHAVFDCDGVILDSNRLKSDAFGLAVADHPPELVTAFVEYHQRNGGVSRYVKFQHFFSEMLRVPDPEPAAKAAVARYAAIVEQNLRSCATIPGVETLLERLQVLGVRCAVNSGGDEQELHRVFAWRGLDTHFHAILGSPTPKADNMKRLLQAGFRFERCVFFGDSRSDWDAARAYGCRFVYVSGVSEWEEGPGMAAEHGFPVIRNFLGL